MNKQHIKIGALAFLAVGIIGALIYFKREYASQARQGIDQYLARSGIGRFVSYGDVAVSVLTKSVTISDLSAKNPEISSTPISAKSIVVSDIKKMTETR